MMNARERVARVFARGALSARVRARARGRGSRLFARDDIVHATRDASNFRYCGPTSD